MIDTDTKVTTREATYNFGSDPEAADKLTAYVTLKNAGYTHEDAITVLGVTEITTTVVSLYESYDGSLAIIRERDGLGYGDVDHSTSTFARDAAALLLGTVSGGLLPPITREDVDQPITIVMRDGRSRGRGRKRDVSERIPVEDGRTMRGWAKVAEWTPDGGVTVVLPLGPAAQRYEAETQ